jgi:4-amino-4-deoxy-L-arabinose transferase-like glycosyltransferase
MGDQVMWLVALAVTAACGATWLLVRRRLRRAEVGSLVVWVGWATTVFIAFSFASGVYHNYYVSLLAPAIAALVGMGASLVLRSGRTGRVVAAGALLATAAIQLVFMRRIDELTALRVLVPVGLVIAAIVLLAQTRREPTRRVALIGVAIAAGAAMIAPAMWVASSLDQTMSGSFPEARPVSLETNVGGGAGGAPGGVPGDAAGPGGQFSGLDEAELAWLRSERTTETWIVAVDSSMQASDAIINGDSVTAMGGFSGGDPAMTTARLAALVADGELRFVVAGGGFGGGLGGGGSIGSTVSSVCTVVSSSEWGGTGDSTLYDCAGQADAIAASTATAPTDGATPGGQPGGQPGGPGGVPADLEALQQCMADQGFDLAAGPPPQNAETLAALTECGFAPQANGGPPVGG